MGQVPPWNCSALTASHCLRQEATSSSRDLWRLRKYSKSRWQRLSCTRSVFRLCRSTVVRSCPFSAFCLSRYAAFSFSRQPSSLRMPTSLFCRSILLPSCSTWSSSRCSDVRFSCASSRRLPKAAKSMLDRSVTVFLHSSSRAGVSVRTFSNPLRCAVIFLR